MDKYNAMTDEQLVKLYEQGEDGAFDVLLGRYQEKVFSYILFLSRDEDAANDIFQDTFVRAIMAIRDHRYQDSGTLGCWLMRIAHNLVLDRARNRKTAPIVSNIVVETGGDTEFDRFDTAEMLEPNAEGQMLIDQSRDELRMLITHLPENQQEIIYLRFFRELSFKEIAQILNISINTALGRVRYAILNLRKLAANRDFYVAV